MPDICHTVSQNIRARVPRATRKVAYGLVLVACGPSGGNVVVESSGTGSGTESETGDPATEFLWTFGGDDQPVLSSPVSDVAGNLFVLVALGATPVDDPTSSEGRFDVDSVALASIASGGVTRWIVSLSGAAQIAPAASVRPVVGPGGDVWVHHGDELIRVGSNGLVKWRSPGIPQGLSSGPVIALAMASDGTAFVLPFIEEDSSEFRQELRAIGSDGVERWRAAVGLPGNSGGDLDIVSPTLTLAPLVAPDGSVLVGCDTCVAGQIGLAQLAASDGASSLIFSLPAQLGAPPTQYSNLRWDGTAIRLNLFETWDAYRVFPNGSNETPDDDPSVFSSWGAAWVPRESVTSSSFSLHLGTEQVVVDVTGTPLENEIYHVASPVAFVEPPAIVIAVKLDPWPPERGVLLVDTEGHVILTARMSGWMDPIPAIGEGFMAYIEPDTQRLVAIEAPVQRVADGPWPIVGGDPQGTRSAEGK